MKRKLYMSALTMVLSVAPLSTAFAYSINVISGIPSDNSGQTTPNTNVTILDFNIPQDINHLTVSPPVTGLSSVNSVLFTGSLDLVSAQPGGNTPSSIQDQTQYLSIDAGVSSNTNTNFGSFTIDITGSTNNYFGLYWGSIDTYNYITFYDNGVKGITISGADVTSLPTGDWNADYSNHYVNFYGLPNFDEVVLWTTNIAFEVDNVAFGVADPVPEPATMMLLGLGLVGIGGTRLRRKK